MKHCTFRPRPFKFYPKKFLIFFPKNPSLKKVLIFSQKRSFLIFPKMEPCIFQPKLEKQNKNPPLEKLLIFQETETPKKLLIFSQKKLFLYFEKREPRKNFLCFRKRNFLILQERNIQNPATTELSYISGKECSEP